MKPFFDALKLELAVVELNYARAKELSIALDAKLGFECGPIEKRLFEGHQQSPDPESRQLWYGLDLQSLQTPYSEIKEMIDLLNPQPGETWIDLGAGYGRMGVSLGFLKPLVRFIGYEFVQERVLEGNRILKKWKLDFAEIRQADLADPSFVLEEAELYFLYDFGSKRDVERILFQLARIARQRKIQVVARGRGVRNWILMDHPWLSGVEAPRHFENWSLFQSAGSR